MNYKPEKLTETIEKILSIISAADFNSSHDDFHNYLNESGFYELQDFLAEDFLKENLL